MSGGLQRDVMEPTTAQQALLDELQQIIGESFTTERRGGVSDANVVAAAGVPTLDGFGPFGDGDHTVHERALKKSFDERLIQVTKILTAFNSEALPVRSGAAAGPLMSNSAVILAPQYRCLNASTSRAHH